MTEDNGTRAEHLEWARTRSLEYLPDKPALAISSISSDLTKHSETAALAYPTGVRLTQLWLDTGDVDQLRRAIEAIA